jgi:hypothetical protein
MTDIKLEKGIPLPRKNEKSNKYPWDTMDIGDSFVFPDPSSPNTPYTAASQTNRRHTDKKFVVRKTDEGYRCWRVK